MSQAFEEPIFEAGQTVTCIRSEGYASLAVGEDYIVHEYEPRSFINTFTWPAYVYILIGGRKVAAHAKRFILSKKPTKTMTIQQLAKLNAEHGGKFFSKEQLGFMGISLDDYHIDPTPRAILCYSDSVPGGIVSADCFVVTLPRPNERHNVGPFYFECSTGRARLAKPI